MILIVGLGNPDRKFQKTRHNLGFRVVDEFVKKNNFPKFKLSKRFKALISEGFFNNKKVIVAKPQTFMNLSGKSAKTLINFYKSTRTVLVIIHDDIDLPLGKIKIVKNRGAAGHKGVQSIIDELGTSNKSLRDSTGRAKNFVRFRIGIQPNTGKPKDIKTFVLQKFNKEEEKRVKKVIKRTTGAIKFAITEGVEKAMTKYNK